MPHFSVLVPILLLLLFFFGAGHQAAEVGLDLKIDPTLASKSGSPWLRYITGMHPYLSAVQFPFCLSPRILVPQRKVRISTYFQIDQGLSH